jgi:hypothetical protein
MKRIRTIIFIGMLGAVLCASAQTAFQPYNTQGDNLIHVTTADFDAVGAKDYVVGMSVNNKLMAYNRPAAMVDPSSSTNRLWEFDLPTFAVMIASADAEGSAADEILVPGLDGRLRILSASGGLLHDWAVGSGAMYCVDVGRTTVGAVRIITGGVDGNVYFLDSTGTQIGSIRPGKTGIIRRVVAGNFDGIGGDEVIVFYSRKGFAGERYIEVYDLDTLSRPAYWGLTEPLKDDVGPTKSWTTGMGWTDKQLPWAYDMDGDGDDEIAAHWGVIHPEDGMTTNLLSAGVPRGELLYIKADYTDVHEDTSTGKYLLQQGVPGNFRDGASYPGSEMFTLYGDDLYLLNYDTNNSVNTDRFRVADYSYAHTLYHFTDGARLEDRSGGLDKMVLAGPANGDDHFYVVNLNDNDWKSDARTIDGNGVLGTVRDTLDDFGDDVDAFSGTVAEAGDPIWYVDYFASWLGWAMTPENIATRADGVLAAIQEWRDKLGGAGYIPSRINFAASLNSDVLQAQTTDPDLTAQGMVDYCEALAQRGVHFCLVIGHGDHVYMSATNLADCFEASVVNGESHMMARTKELSETGDVDVYKPHMDAVRARATTLGVHPPKIMLCGKGAIFSAMTPAQASIYFPDYKDTLVLGVENSNVTVLDWSFAERAGLWLNGDVESWGCNSIGDNLAANRIVEWGGMRNGHVVLRHLLSQYALGADVFRTTSIIGKENPLFERGDTTDPELQWSNPYRQGIWNFLKIVDAGVYPNGPEPGQLKGVSPVAAALPSPNYTRLSDQDINHDYNKYEAQTNDYVINNLACWYAYTDIPDFDANAVLHGSIRRWDNLFPTSPSGFVPMIPYSSRAALETNAWCNRAFETDGDSWDEFQSLETARDTISAELEAQKINQMFYVDNECFWQITESKNDPDTLFGVFMDSSTLSPTDRSVQLRKGAAAGVWLVYDQFGSQSEPLASLSETGDGLSFDIPAGSMRFLVLKKLQPITTPILGIAWDGETTPALAIYGMNGEIIPSGRGIDGGAGSNDGTFGAAYSGAGLANGAYKVNGVEHHAGRGRISLTVTNGTGAAVLLESLLFDYSRWYTDSPTNVSVSYLSGDLAVDDNTLLASYVGSGVLSRIADYDDFNVSLTNLPDATLAHGEHAVFRLEAAGASGSTTSGAFDNLGLVLSGVGGYDTWAAEYGLYASNAWKTADLEPDGINNWTEYVLGGNPTNSDASAILPTMGIEGSWLEYAYRRRSDYQARGLTYTVEATTNLVSNDWNTNGVLDAGFDSIDAEIDSVTNRVSTEEHPEQFIRLRVE